MNTNGIIYYVQIIIYILSYGSELNEKDKMHVYILDLLLNSTILLFQGMDFKAKIIIIILWKCAHMQKDGLQAAHIIHLLIMLFVQDSLIVRASFSVI